MGRISAGGSAARFVSLVSVPILTRLLEPEDYGLAALAATVVSLLSVVATRGLNLGYVRYASSPGTSRFAAVERHVWRSALVRAGILLSRAVFSGSGRWPRLPKRRVPSLG